MGGAGMTAASTSSYMMAAPAVSYGFAAPVQTQMYTLAPSFAYGAAPVAYGAVPHVTYGAAPNVTYGTAPSVVFGSAPNVALGTASTAGSFTNGQSASTGTIMSVADLQSVVDSAFDRKLQEFNSRRADSSVQEPTFLGDVRAILDIIRLLPRFRDEPDCNSAGNGGNESLEDLRRSVRRLELDVEELRRSRLQGDDTGHDGAGSLQDTRIRSRPQQSLTSVRHPTESSERSRAGATSSDDPLMDQFDRVSREAKVTIARLQTLK